MNTIPEQLTTEQRDRIERLFDEDGQEALRIVDAQAATLAKHAEARVAELEANSADHDEFGQYTRAEAAEARLADANALLGRVTDIDAPTWSATWEAIKAFLSGQPAAPTRAEAEQPSEFCAKCGCDVFECGGNITGRCIRG